MGISKGWDSLYAELYDTSCKIDDSYVFLLVYQDGSSFSYNKNHYFMFLNCLL